MAIDTFIEKLACVGGHVHRLFMLAFRAVRVAFVTNSMSVSFNRSYHAVARG